MYVQLGEDVAYILINNSCVKFEFYGQYVAFVFFVLRILSIMWMFSLVWTLRYVFVEFSVTADFCVDVKFIAELRRPEGPPSGAP